MSPRGPVAVALTYGFTSLGSHPAPSLRQQNIYFLLLFPHPGAISPMGTISPMGDISHMTTVYTEVHQTRSLDVFILYFI